MQTANNEVIAPKDRSKRPSQLNCCRPITRLEVAKAAPYGTGQHNRTNHMQAINHIELSLHTRLFAVVIGQDHKINEATDNRHPFGITHSPKPEGQNHKSRDNSAPQRMQ